MKGFVKDIEGLAVKNTVSFLTSAATSMVGGAAQLGATGLATAAYHLSV